MANVAAMVGATGAWTRGIDGTGVGVALIDSGIGADVEGLDAPGAVIDGPDFTADAGTAAAHVDTAGHGTHLAGIIAGRPHRATGAEGDFTGIAPGAHLIDLKARAADGTTQVGDVTEAVRWAIAHRVELNIRVINLSFNTTNPSDDLAAALQDAWRSGITVVVSAGNDGAEATTLRRPPTTRCSSRSAPPTTRAPSTSPTTSWRTSRAAATPAPSRRSSPPVAPS